MVPWPPQAVSCCLKADRQVWGTGGAAARPEDGDFKDAEVAGMVLCALGTPQPTRWFVVTPTFWVSRSCTDGSGHVPRACASDGGVSRGPEWLLWGRAPHQATSLLGLGGRPLHKG